MPFRQMPEFEYFAVVDWSGARGPNLAGIAVALCPAGDAPPQLVLPDAGTYWTRQGVLDWLLGLKRAKVRVLIGFDFCFTAPYIDENAYFPGQDWGRNAQMLWRRVEDICAGDPDLGAWSLPRHPQLSPHFLRPGARGARFSRRLRLTERICRTQKLGAAESVFHLIGPSQVGLGSFAGMRLLHRLDGIPVWPWDGPGREGPLVVEFFTRRALILAGLGGAKVRDIDKLNQGLEGLRSAPAQDGANYSDHACDALLSAAGLRVLAQDPKYWRPEQLSARVAATEGWTFGIP